MPNINIDKLQRPERALLISTAFIKVEDFSRMGFNALNGLSSFLRTKKQKRNKMEVALFQRPKRALFISTVWGNLPCAGGNSLFQRPKRALFISTSKAKNIGSMTPEDVSTP